MVRRSLLGALGAAGAVAVLVLGSTAAHATPVPDNGPVAGGTTVSVPEPAGVTFTEIAAGYWHSVALGSDGHAYAWGYNGSGRLGNGTTVDSSSPVQVQVPAGVTFTEIAAGGAHSVALGSDGNAYAWGSNGSGRLGDGTTVSSSSPVHVAGVVVVTNVSFDGTAGTNLVDNGDGTWSVDAPAHPEGPVDVEVSYTWNGIAQTPVTYPEGYTYTNVTTELAVTGSTATPAVLIAALIALLLGAGLVTANRRRRVE